MVNERGLWMDLQGTVSFALTVNPVNPVNPVEIIATALRYAIGAQNERGK